MAHSNEEQGGDKLLSTQRGFWRAVLWAAVMSMVITAIILGTGERLAREENGARLAAMREAEALANAYATQLEHMFEQIDQVTRRIAYAWRDHPQMVDLERDQQRGLFPGRHDFFVFIADANGRVVRGSVPIPPRANLSEEEFFQAQRAGCCSGLLVSPLTYGTLTQRKVVRFSRRLEGPDGRFAGVVFVGVVPDFLATFQDESLQGLHDFVSVRLDIGPLLATRLGKGARGWQVFYRKDPIFAQPRGVRLEPREKFRDQRSRFVAWRKIPDSPLVALAGLGEDDALADLRQRAHAYRLTAASLVLLLGVLTFGGILFFTRLEARRRSEEEVRRTYRIATESANEGFYMLRPLLRDGLPVDLLIEDCNERAAWLLNTTRERLIGERAARLMVHGQRLELLELVCKAMTQGQYEDEFRVPAGWMRAEWVFRRAVRFESGIALTIRDISDAKAHEQALADLANIDALTRLPNRHWLQGFLPRVLAHAEAGNGSFALLFIDLDNFKTVNDTLGHEAGDELLQAAAQRIRRAVRASDHVVRLGGDEFTVILEHVDDDAAVAQVAQSIVRALSAPFALSAGSGNRINASIGISVWPRDGSDAEVLVKHADVAMYAAKAAGKGRYLFYDSGMSEALLLRLSRERALREAVEHEQFAVHYQPRVDARSGRLCSFEALLRWRHPERGLVAPGEFIDLAEDTGLVVPIGDWVLREVVGQLAQWRAAGETLVPVSVNVSPLQLRHGQLAEGFLRALREQALEPALVEVEVTESAVVDRSEQVVRQLDALRDGGVRLMIDDFGAGHSSLAQLHRLDVDVLKVDRGFTSALSEGSEGEQLYRAIISMAEALEMRVVAEGVETLAQLRKLRTLGCDELQGYLISRPLPPEQVPALLHQGVLPPFDHLEAAATA